MLSIAHGVSGAFIASKIPSPALSIPLILASHYALDAVPHWDVGTGLSKGTRSRRTALLAEIPDFLLTFLLIYLWFSNGDSFFALTTTSPFWGGILALLPDFLEAPRNFLGREPMFLKKLNNFHHRFHHSIPRVVSGLIPQLLLLTLIYALR